MKPKTLDQLKNRELELQGEIRARQLELEAIRRDIEACTLLQATLTYEVMEWDQEMDQFVTLKH